MLLILLLIIFVLLSIMDIMTTHKAMQEGLYEYNFLLRALYKRWNTKGHIFLKLLTAVIYLPLSTMLSLEVVATINVVFAVIVINNLWVIDHARD